MQETGGRHDVVVVGGGAAGLSGALTLARARRSVLVIDAGEQRNRPASGVHGFLTRDGLPPAEVVALGRAEVERYGGRIVDGRVTALTGSEGAFGVTLEDGRSAQARRLLIATGLVDELPHVPGLRELWGTDVLHCPYCHGHEVRDEPIGVLCTGPRAVHLAQLFRQWSADVTLFLHTGPRPSADEAAGLAARGIAVAEGEVVGLATESGRLRGVRLASGEVVPRRRLAVSTTLVARAEALVGIGLAATDHPSGAGLWIEADSTGRTAVPGVWVAGNVSDLMAWVVAAASAGVMAGAMINNDLVTEDTRIAVERATAVGMEDAA
ncbi:MAG TPA: NAD(P)/FAD-dependent oxidoreductase [Solirubrobacteraceae bacterium]|nr:NAD(P)/FAD-dependent oxidoreductase [Solirubrobacteraceae bacterium]